MNLLFLLRRRFILLLLLAGFISLAQEAPQAVPGKSAVTQADQPVPSNSLVASDAPVFTEPMVCQPAGDEFKSYERPMIPESPFLSWARHLADIVFFIAMLAVGTWVVLGNRRRIWFYGLSLMSAGYFGFIRHGCICSVGAIGNVCQALIHPAIALPAVAVIFFFLPLLLALFCGRIFCGTVCPLGALQVLLARQPHRVPEKFDRILRIGPWLMLGWAILSAWMQLGLPICRMDPFIPLFQLAAYNSRAWIYTIAVLVLCVYVPRPHCRWLCPYSALLSLVSRLAIHQRQLDLHRCKACNHCAKQCPVQAIAPPRLDFSACVQCGRCRTGCQNHSIR